MPSISGNRELGAAEITKLLTERDATKRDGHLAHAIKWPGFDNLRTLAEAVANRNKFVIFTGNKKFQIRYDSKYDAVFVKPANDKDGFAPCGYFSFKKLKEALEDANIN